MDLGRGQDKIDRSMFCGLAHWVERTDKMMSFEKLCVEAMY